jgi:hypothetical protein
VSRRLPPKAERRALLRERGWTQIGAGGAESWRHPRYPSSHFFTLAAAFRAEISGRLPDKPDLSPMRPRRPYRETPDVVAGLRRLILSVGKRVAEEDPDDLRYLVALKARLQQAFTTAVMGLRRSGYSDGQIGAVLGSVTKQAVQQRWPRKRDDDAGEEPAGRSTK